MKLSFLFRDLKNGEWNLLIMVLFLAATCVSSTVLLTEGVKNSLQESAGTLLGGDRLLSSSTPVAAEIKEKTTSFELKTTETLTFLSMLVHGDDLALSEVKAVDEHYPLKGELRGSTELFAKEEGFADIPEPGTVWLESSLFSLLNVNMNDTIQIGAAPFKITRVLSFEPDRGGEGLSFAPRALINQKDITRTEVITAGSRQTYFLLLAGEADNIKKFETYVKPKLNHTQNLISSNQAKPVVKNLFDQAQNYIYLILAINLILACLALFEVAQCFYQREKQTVAILRCFGASFRWIYIRYSLSILLIGFFVSTLGFIFGFAVVWLAKGIFEKFLYQEIQMAWLIPAIMTVVLALIILFIFVILPLNGLRKIVPIRILRGDNDQNGPTFSWVGRALKSMLMNSIGRLGVRFRYGVSNLIRNLKSNGIQLLAFSFVLTAVLLLILIRGDLLQNWRKQVPAFAPNYFVINIGKEDVSEFQQSLLSAGIETHGLYPVIRGRLLAVNNELVLSTEDSEASEDAKARQLKRLLNLTFTADIPKDNQITAGAWFTKDDWGRNVVSIEEGFADRMRIKINDELKFSIGEKTLNVIVTSIRKVEWDSFSPNFYLIFPPQVLDSFPSTFMTSFYVPEEKLYVLKKLVHDFPAISLIDITVLIKQLTKSIDTLAFGVEYLFGFTLVMTLMLLLAAIVSSLDERRHNAIILRAIGVPNKTLRGIMLTEFMLLGFAAGILAVIFTLGLYTWLLGAVFQLTFSLTWGILLLGPVLGLSIVSAAGWFGIRKTIKISPMAILSSRFSRVG